ncbi:hypothetical protein AGR1B_Cc120031 [Agrobacterium fabacearum S56]|nr:hypothetical protein AGR1B_Cc120031 [Agrobacterium fabacearum S56]
MNFYFQLLQLIIYLPQTQIIPMYYVTGKNVPEIERMAALRHFALQYHFSAVLSGPLTYSCAFSPPFSRQSCSTSCG